MANELKPSVTGLASVKQIDFDGEKVTVLLEVDLTNEEATKLFREFLAKNGSMSVEIREGL